MGDTSNILCKLNDVVDVAAVLHNVYCLSRKNHPKVVLTQEYHYT